MRNDKKWIIIKIEIEMKTKQKNNDDDDDNINWWETYFMNQSNQSINLLKWPEKSNKRGHWMQILQVEKRGFHHIRWWWQW